jgi:hypothetical protein
METPHAAQKSRLHIGTRMTISRSEEPTASPPKDRLSALLSPVPLVGTEVGTKVGATVGCLEGRSNRKVGLSVGTGVGGLEGPVDGATVGETVGLGLGA